jgi:hypothetical protein
MSSMDWQVAIGIATVVSGIAVAVTAVIVAVQLRQAAHERYFAITAHLFEIWQSPEFQHDQLFLLHKLPCSTWGEFCALGRGEHAERALHRVGGYYDRVGNLVRHNLIHREDILPTIGGYAVAVWDRIEPLVKELRLRENAVLFQNYESLLPECHDCYVPGSASVTAADLLSAKAVVTEEFDQACAAEPATTLSIDNQPNGTAPPDLKAPASLAITETSAMTDTGSKSNGQGQIAPDLTLPDSDGIPHRISEFTASGATVLVYARGHT